VCASFEFCPATRALKITYASFLQHFSSTVKAYASLTSWTAIICALNDFVADYARLTHTFI
jgi:hypothetical protein